jgi:ATP-dependent exoDNAse (exonuclease V) beta subunit
MQRVFSKFNYISLERVNIDGKRHYSTPEDKVPSVTTILSATKDMTHLQQWMDRVGKAEAAKIVAEAAARGTSMHGHLEDWLRLDKHANWNDFSDLHVQMADVIRLQLHERLTELWGSEVGLYFPYKYAGTTDVVGILDGKPCIVDFKQTNKPKKEEWIEDYKLQLVSYALAHNKIHGTDIRNGRVFMCSKELEFQEFKVTESDFKFYCDLWWRRVEEYERLRKN